MKKIYLLLVFLFSYLIVFTQQTVGLFLNDSTSFNGYTLFAPSAETETYLIDNCGFIVNTWEASNVSPGNSVYLLENGNLLKTGRINSDFISGGTGGRLEIYSWEDELLWSYNYSSQEYHHHHDVSLLPNGNILLLAWEKHDNMEVIENGRIPMSTSGDVWAEQVVEIKPIGTDDAEIVWQWSVWDHMIQDFDSTKLNYGVVADHPELLDINFGLGNGDNVDWIHFNSIDYNPDLDQILLSSRHLSEIYIIDHSTTTAEAATHEGGDSGRGGDFLFRWGNPISYGQGDVGDRKFYGQHDAKWIPNGMADEGKIMVFNNGLSRPGGSYSSVDVIEPTLENNNVYTISAEGSFAPADLFWTYSAPVPTDLYSSIISGAHRLPNGNTLICEGREGNFLEVDYDGDLVWHYKAPFTFNGIVSQGTQANNVNIFRATKYAPEYEAFMGKDLTPTTVIELNPLPSDCEIFGLPVAVNSIEVLEGVSILGNPIQDFIYVKNDMEEGVIVEVFDWTGRLVNNTITNDKITQIDAVDWEDGFYVVRVFNEERNQFFVEKIVKVR